MVRVKISRFIFNEKRFKKIQIINNHPFSNQIDIVCQKNVHATLY